MNRQKKAICTSSRKLMLQLCYILSMLISSITDKYTYPWKNIQENIKPKKKHLNFSSSLLAVNQKKTIIFKVFEADQVFSPATTRL